jgi:putative membrane protein
MWRRIPGSNSRGGLRQFRPLSAAAAAHDLTGNAAACTAGHSCAERLAAAQGPMAAARLVWHNRTMDYPGIDGFLGTRASLMLDVVFIAMFAIVPVLGWSIYLVKFRRNYELHKQIQVVLLIVLGAAVTMFELDVRFFSGWRERAEASPYYGPASEADSVSRVIFIDLLGRPHVPGWVFRLLMIHLVFAVSTAFLWLWVGVRALRRYSSPPIPGPHSRSHLFWGKIAAWDMLLTAVTGCAFYWLAFVA